MIETEEALSDKRGIQSVDTAIAILQAVANAGGPKPLGVIAKLTGNGPSTTHRYLASLVRGGMVRQDSATGWYDLGPGALALGSSALQRMDALGVTQAEAARISSETGHTCFVTIWTAKGPMIVRWFHGNRPVFTSAGVGSVLPVLTSSCGQIFAAHLAPHTARTALEDGNESLSNPEVEALLSEVRTCGFSSIDGLIVSGLRGVSVPVFDIQGQVQCVLSLLGTDLGLVQFPNDAQLRLIKGGQAASRELGFEWK